MGAIIDWLDGKKTILAGLLVTLIAGLQSLGVKLPFDAPAESVILTVLGVLVVIGRMFAKKPGIAATPKA